MEGFLPFTKSFASDVKVCPWKAYQHKVCRVWSVSGRAAIIGSTVHKIVASIRKGEFTLENFLGDDQFRESGEFSEAEYDDIVYMVKNAIYSDPWFQIVTSAPESIEIENYTAIDANGKATHDKEKALVHGFLDRYFLLDHETAVVDDLKTARSEEDNETERFCYVLLAFSRYSNIKRVLFALHFIRTGHYRKWQYDFDITGKGKKQKWEVTEISPEGESRKLTGVGENPLLLSIKAQIAEIETMSAVPIPGPHCESWYGEPCQFLGNGCPLEQQTEGVVDDIVPLSDGSAVARLRNMLIEGAPITQTDASWALSGIMQLEGFTKRLRKTIEGWSKNHGPIPLGESKYGWVTTKQNDVDKVAALGFMLDAMTIEEIAAVISISKTNLDKKISKKTHAATREMCLAMAVTEVDSRPKFTAIQEDAIDD